MQVLIRHILGVQPDPPLTDSANVGEIGFVTTYATRSGSIGHADVSETGQTLFTRDANEMLRVEILALCFGVLTGKYELITSSTPGFEMLRVMSLTVDVVVKQTIDKVHQRLCACGADKAGRMPEFF